VPPKKTRPRLAVWKFSSCDGCQLSLLDCEDELLALNGAFDVAYFLEVTRVQLKGPYDLSIVEGSISNASDIERIRKIRAESKALITIGACATSGGIQALRNFRNYDSVVKAVYARPDYIDSLATSTAIADHVKVDFELRGCPVDRRQLLEVLSAYLNNRKPLVAPHSVCLECKLSGAICVMVAHGTPCLGPVTHAGCGSLCPRHDRGCYGCFGPSERANTASLTRHIAQLGLPERELAELYRSFNANAEPFRKEGDAHEGK
jgi:coenzyme F420-reducing hydrogenase gamma subunit